MTLPQHTITMDATKEQSAEGNQLQDDDGGGEISDNATTGQSIFRLLFHLFHFSIYLTFFFTSFPSVIPYPYCLPSLHPFSQSLLPHLPTFTRSYYPTAITPREEPIQLRRVQR